MSIPYVPADRLARYQVMDARAMQDRCSSTREEESGPMGGPPTITPTAILTNIPCRLRPASAQTRAQEGFTPTGRMEDAQLWTLSLPLGTNILLNDLVTVNGHTLRVVATDAGGTYATSLTVTATEYTY